MIGSLFLLLFDAANLPPGEAVAKVATIREQLTASSFQWTGIEQRGASNPVVIEEICKRLRQVNILIEQTELTNVEKAKAHAIINALDNLIASPEPEWSAIVNLLSAPALSNVLGVANIVLFIFQLLGSH